MIILLLKDIFEGRAEMSAVDAVRVLERAGFTFSRDKCPIFHFINGNVNEPLHPRLPWDSSVYDKFIQEV